MRVQCIGIKMKERLPRIRTSWLCLLAALIVVALAAGLEERKILAQESSQQTVTDYVTDAAPPTPAKPQPPATKTPSSGKAESSSQSLSHGEKGDPGGSAPSGAMAAPSSNGASAVAAAPKPEAAPVFPVDPKNPVAVDTANLMKLANTLKSEVDKTTKDTLSVTVVREANEIEQLAHRMRTK
jgi:hypothetical protein